MKDSENNLGFWEVLCLILITLRLTNQIDWWWGWVFAPWVGRYILGYIVLLLGWLWKNKTYL